MKSTISQPFANTIKDVGVQICLTSLALFLTLRLWRFDWLTPFNYHGDTIYQLSLVKSITLGDWIWSIDRLSAPFTLASGAFPQNLTFSSAIMKLLALATKEPGLVLNLFWLTAITLTSINCFVALRSLKVSHNTSWVFSTLYALLPYTFIRNTAHISLTYIFIPIISAYAINTLSKASNAITGSMNSDDPPLSRSIIAIALIGIGFDYIYNAFFSCFFLTMAGLISWFQSRDIRTTKKMALSVGLVMICVVINFLPSLWIWQEIGTPLSYKGVDDAEIYGLKIRHLISSPALISLFPLKIPINFPLENENQSAMLGLVGSIGLIASILFGLTRLSARWALSLWAAGALCISGIMLGTIGGFGVIFNQLVSPEIRAYNRISVFIAFFAFYTFAILFDRIQSLLEIRFKKLDRPKLGKAICIAILFSLFFFALYDQSKPAIPYLIRKNSETKMAIEERAIVREIEALQPPIHQIYQLPETPFPVDPGLEKMGPYDHGRPYIWSHQLRWSWPNYSSQHKEWVFKLGDSLGPLFLDNLVAAGFDGIWIDRFGFNLADLNKIEARLKRDLGTATITSNNGRYQFYNLQPFILISNKNIGKSLSAN
jgi:phosphoglycerol transferase